MVLFVSTIALFLKVGNYKKVIWIFWRFAVFNGWFLNLFDFDQPSSEAEFKAFKPCRWTAKKLVPIEQVKPITFWALSRSQIWDAARIYQIQPLRSCTVLQRKLFWPELFRLFAGNKHTYKYTDNTQIFKYIKRGQEAEFKEF